jgi:hypothetical protein
LKKKLQIASARSFDSSEGGELQPANAAVRAVKGQATTSHFITVHLTHLAIWEREIQVGSTRVYISKMSFRASFQKVGGASPIGQPATAA